MTIIHPDLSRTYVIRCEAAAPISHHNPDQQDDSNVSLFRRQDQLVTIPEAAGRTLSQERLDHITATHPVPLETADLLEDLDPAAFLATAILVHVIQLYGGGEGTGLFTGRDRYARLGSRVKQRAVSSRTVRQFWSSLLEALQLPTRSDGALLELLALPETASRAILATLAAEAPSCILLARQWAKDLKAANVDYALSADIPQTSGALLTRSLRVTDLPQPQGSIVQPIPGISANAARHVMVREPGMLHLLEHLDIAIGDLPPSAGYLLNSGGTLRKGMKAPTNERLVGEEIADRYPFLGLLGGAADSMMLPAGSLSVSCWLVCLENARALARLGVTPEHPAEDLVSHHTLVKHPQRWGESPMPFAFEALAPGATFLVEFRLSPFPRPYVAGALGAAITRFMQQASIGGQGARGYGDLIADWHETPALAHITKETAAYEAYLADNRSELRRGLLDGTLGWSKTLLAV